MTTRVESEVSGKLWKLLVKPGDRVEAGDVLMILESMKTEIPVESPAAGEVAELLVQEGDAVEEFQEVAVLR